MTVRTEVVELLLDVDLPAVTRVWRHVDRSPLTATEAELLASATPDEFQAVADRLRAGEPWPRAPRRPLAVANIDSGEG